MSDRRLRACAEAWPACQEGEYNPSCCRFPKSCSCTVYDPDRVTEDQLEVSPWVALMTSGAAVRAAAEFETAAAKANEILTGAGLPPIALTF